MSNENTDDDDTYVLVELTGVIDGKMMELEGKQCTILGVDTAEPVLKLGSYLFTGQYKDTLGTCVLFEDITEPDKASSKPLRKQPKKLKLFAMAEKRLDMKTSFLQDKVPTAVSDDEDTTDMAAQQSS